ncbi:MAG: LysR family transcriptional regulator [Piscinibacter sp.]|uniref:LysR family transcriptional regulator n=1 Tax=Piscinibacter sp. TaxID=1903157 RepID=UPI00258E9143|nr:LysR family transcriptional regulator [Piscinibacter sp.]MCW5663155.1 LysR family transcriptional regulator [Piscinibacter sp.]
MRRKIPSTGALAAFEAAARHQSYTKAAEELAVTQSAVCRQIAALEEFLGVRLFQRSRRGVALTDAGQRYGRQVRARLEEVERDALELMSRGAEGVALELGVVPTFATKWLLPRLPGFTRAHPSIQVHLTARTRPFLFDDTPFHAAIHAGTGAWPGTEGLFLLPESLVAVASPALAAGRRDFTAGDWRNVVLLQQGTRPYAWRDWFAAQGLRVEGDLAGPRLELFSMLAEAATRSMGVALVPPFLVEDELARGSLVTVSPQAVPSGRAYRLIYPERESGSAALRLFGAWLQTQAQAATA